MVYAIIVTYNPEQKLLDSQFKTLFHQVDGIVYVDNGSSIKPTLPQNDYVNVIWNEENEGLGKAQNQGIKLAIEKGAKYVLLLDQDSELGANMVDTLKKELVKLDKNAASIAPIALSAYTGIEGKCINSLGFTVNYKEINGTEEVAYTIASGMLIPINVIRVVGEMNEELFIDGVDLEWCLRARSLGYRIFQSSKAKLLHRLGNGKRSNIFSHSDFREYFIVRNSFLLARLSYIPLTFRIRRVVFSFFRIACSLFLLRMTYFKKGIKGLKDGMSVKNYVVKAKMLV